MSLRSFLKKISRILPDKLYLQLKFYQRVGKWPNLEDPQTFNEKIQWLKLYDRKPIYTTLVDKYEVKKYVADIIGEEHIIPTLGVWDHFDDIDFDTLPAQFVLKCTHDSGGLVIVRDKAQLDIAAARTKLISRMKNNYYWHGREWPYKYVKPRIIAEKFIEDPGKVVPEDYKVYCINEKPHYIVVFHNRFNDNEVLSETVYDTDWVPQHISLDEHFEISDIIEPRPKCLEELLCLAKKLCQGMSQARIDFYIVDSQIYFGEITLYTANGFQKMIPEEIDENLGALIDLSIVQ